MLNENNIQLYYTIICFSCIHFQKENNKISLLMLEFAHDMLLIATDFQVIVTNRMWILLMDEIVTAS